MTLKIATVSQKGGTGKTSAALCLASYWANKKKKVLVVDLDSQKNASLALGAPNAEKNVRDLFAGKDSITQTPAGIDLIAGDSTLYLTDRINPKSLQERLPEGYDLIILDTPPAINDLTLTAVAAADIVLIPLLADVFSLQGLRELMPDLQAMRKLNKDFKTMAYFNKAAKTAMAKQLEPLFANVCKENGLTLLKSKVRQTIAISESAAAVEPLFDYAGRFSNAISDFSALAREIEKVSK